VELKVTMEILDEDWNVFVKNNDPQGLKKTGLTACMIIAGFFAALRGEEIVRIDVGSMRKHWEEAMAYKDGKHVPLMMARRFKRETGEKLFCQPLAIDSTSGVEIAKWFHRALWVLGRLGIETGPLF
jgi:hypothetical protein